MSLAFGKRLAPGVPDLVFALVLGSVLIGGRHRLLNDPGTPWHLRLGRDLARTGLVPRSDGLTFTRAGEAWVDQSWLFDRGLAWVVDHGGWSAAAAAAAVGLAWLYSSLTRALIGAGISPLVGLVTGVLAAGIGSIHFLMRPHLFTLGFFFILTEICRRQHERGGRVIFLAVPLTALWANLHGGFLAAPLVVFTAAAGHCVSGRLDPARRRQVVLFAAVGVLCIAAAVINPYGLGLYRHVGRLLVSSGVTELIEEYQPTPFGNPDARVMEWVILALVALPVVASGRMSRYELMHALVWLHLSLASFRHAPLFALAVAPGLARVVDGLFQPGFDERTSRVEPRSLWPAVGAAGRGRAVWSGVSLTSFDPTHWPLDGLKVLNERPVGNRLFHEQDWGGLIEAESRPVRRAYLDDRFELYGKAFLLEYLNALQGGPDWEKIRDSGGIRLVWVRPDRGLARRIEQDTGWRVVHRDAVSVLFERLDPGRVPESVARGGRSTSD